MENIRLKSVTPIPSVRRSAPEPWKEADKGRKKNKMEEFAESFRMLKLYGTTQRLQPDISY